MSSEDQTPGSIVRQAGSAVKANLLAAAATGIVGGIIAAFGAAWALAVTVPNKVGIVPSGAVMAFDLKSGCPIGWEAYKEGTGRFIVGATSEELVSTIPRDFAAGLSDIDGNSRKFRTPGGAQSHKITLEEMPKHQHQTSAIVNESQAIFGASYPPGPKLIPDGGDAALRATANTNFAGEGRAMSIVPPYVALWLCKKR